MFRASDFKCREVINLVTGERLGYVCDLEIDECSGQILAIVVPGRSKFGIFFKMRKSTHTVELHNKNKL
ncbi:MAG: YlmC/YmxH family sporulation protein [Clostridiales bacterium]|nr:MAG: YlmC/YmxH family sporulation protein [Clostridiales bacterium]